jgi:hypothetical protein
MADQEREDDYINRSLRRPGQRIDENQIIIPTIESKVPKDTKLEILVDFLLLSQYDNVLFSHVRNVLN